MGKFHAFAMVTTLYCGTIGPAIGAEPDDTTTPSVPSTAPAPRPEPPVAPRKYLETGARLFNKGRYELAGKYFEAAELYRDRLTSNERVVLDIYREKFDDYSRAPKPEAPVTASVPTSHPQDAEVKAASTVGRSVGTVGPITSPAVNGADSPAGPSPTNPFSEPPSNAAGIAPTAGHPSTGVLRDTTDTKQKARWLLQLARDQMIRGKFEDSERTIAEARTYQVKWSMFDETPDKLSAALAKARAKAEKGKSKVGREGATDPNSGLDPNLPHDRRTARSLLRDARVALDAGLTDRAEAIAREVRTWDLRYNLFEDTPDKLSVAVSEARRREATRSADLMVRSYLGSAARPQNPDQKEPPPPTLAPKAETPPPE